jgi:hypothetical protein
MASDRRVALVSAGDGSGCLFVVDEVGLIRVIGPDGTLEPEPFLDLRSRIVSPMAGVDERGLLGLAFHPRYADNGRFFAYYSAPLGAGAPAGYDHMSHASEFRVSATDRNGSIPARSGSRSSSTSRSSMITAARSCSARPRGYLHISLGDVLRIDVDAGMPYGIRRQPVYGHAGVRRRLRRDLGIRTSSRPTRPAPPERPKRSTGSCGHAADQRDRDESRHCAIYATNTSLGGGARGGGGNAPCEHHS